MRIEVDEGILLALPVAAVEERCRLAVHRRARVPHDLPGGLVGPSWRGYGDAVSDGVHYGEGRRVNEPQLWYNMVCLNRLKGR